MNKILLIIVLLAFTATCLGQVSIPVTVSAASYERNAALAPGSIASTFGTKLATTTLSATDTNPATPTIELPTTLGGTTVRVNNALCDLLFVSPRR
jgi:uncharacterized protein (TIGR03437 family)